MVNKGRTHAGDGGQLETLVKDELSAVETYKQALQKVGKEAAAGEELTRIEKEHEEAVKVLRTQMDELGMQSPSDSGLWGTWSKIVEGGAKALGEKAAIKALKEGEEHGIHDYEAALDDESLNADVKQLISARLLPQTRAHVPTLDRLLEESAA